MKRPYDCTLGLINTRHHDVIIPQGGVHRGSLEANSKRFPAGLKRNALSPGQARQSQVPGRIQAIEKKQHDPRRQRT